MPVSIGMMWMASSSRTAGATMAYGNHQPACRWGRRAPVSASSCGGRVATNCDEAVISGKPSCCRGDAAPGHRPRRPVPRTVASADGLLRRLHGGPDVVLGDGAPGGDLGEHGVHGLADGALELVLDGDERKRLGTVVVDVGEGLHLSGVVGEGGLAVLQRRQ